MSQPKGESLVTAGTCQMPFLSFSQQCRSREAVKNWNGNKVNDLTAKSKWWHCVVRWQEATEQVFERLCKIVDSPSSSSDAAADHQRLQFIARQVIADGEISRHLHRCNSGLPHVPKFLNEQRLMTPSALWCASGCVVECWICDHEVACSNLGQGYFAPRSTLPSIPPGLVNEYQL